jgi:hypothetical protein
MKTTPFLSFSVNNFEIKAMQLPINCGFLTFEEIEALIVLQT